MNQPLAIKLEESLCSELASSDGNNDDTVECKSSSFSSTYNDGTLLYSLRQKPSIILSTLSAIQVIIIIIFSVIWLPLTQTKSLCIHPDDPGRVEIISLSMFSSGLSTILFSTIGLRLPVLLIPSAQYMNSLNNILKIPELKCLGAGDLYAMGHENRILEWQNRLKYLQGGILMTSLLQLLLGITGISGLFDVLLSNPLVLIPTTIIVGFSYANQIMNITVESDIFTERYDTMPWGIIILTVGVLIIAGLKFQHLEFKLPSYTHKEGFSAAYLKLFRMFPVLFASFIVLIIYPCISRIINGRNEDEKVFLEQSFENSRSYYFHLPFMYGWPSFHSDAFLHLLPAATIQMIQSILVYRVTNFIYGQNIKRTYVNKGISMEGFSSFIAGIFGMTAVASPINIGIMQLTGVGSRRVTQLSGIFLILLSISPSFIEVLVHISPVFILTTLFIISAIISVTGLSMMQRINMSSFRSCIIIGLSLFAASVIPGIIPNIKTELRLIQIIVDIFSSNLIICVTAASLLNSMLPRRETIDILHEEPEIEKEKEKQGLSFCEECFTMCLA